jgi:hypothetical protein
LPFEIGKHFLLLFTPVHSLTYCCHCSTPGNEKSLYKEGSVPQSHLFIIVCFRLLCLWYVGFFLPL